MKLDDREKWILREMLSRCIDDQDHNEWYYENDEGLIEYDHELYKETCDLYDKLVKDFKNE